MAVLMTLNHNGQAITLSKKLADKGAVDGASLAKLMASDKREYTFAQTFPTGTHAMWLYYWMAANGINPMKDAKVITVPPPQMVANMRVGNMDGYCVGEPWATAPSSTALASPLPPRKTFGKTTPKRCWALPASSSKNTPTPPAPSPRPFWKPGAGLTPG